MKLTFESIQPTNESSFKLMVNPRLSDFFFWHFHPEFELVYIEASQGTRHVGDHISTFEESDLVFIGSNIPHLNFDYKVKSEYTKMVVHIRADFQSRIATIPELEKVVTLFSEAARGVAFGKATKDKLKERITKIHLLSDFDRYLELLSLFKVLAEATDKVYLHEAAYNSKFSKKEHQRLNRIYTFVEQSYHRSVSLEEVAELSYFSKAAFCRYFKHMTKLTFIEFLNNYRISQAKRYLLSGKNVTETAGLCGFESISYFNKTFKKLTSENPLSFKNKFTTN